MNTLECYSIATISDALADTSALDVWIFNLPFSIAHDKPQVKKKLNLNDLKLNH